MGTDLEFDLETVALPTLDNLSTEGIDAIHEASMHILEEQGVRIAHDGGIDLLCDNGAEVIDNEEGIVSIPQSLVEDAIETVPSSFTLHARNSDNDVVIGDGDPKLASGYGAPNVLRYEEGHRPSRIEDYELLVKLAQMEDAISITGYNLCEPNDVPQEVKHYEMIERSLRLTDKPILASTYGEDRSRASLEMAGIVNEDRDLDRPYAAGIINTISPRHWDTKMVEGLIEFAKHGQPAVISAAMMANASGPSTLAGSMALANAEIMTGVVLTQLVNPGAPVIYGLPSANVDVRHGSFSIGSPEGALFVAFAAQIGRYYDIPSRAGGCLTDSKTIDDQSGAESMMQLLTTMQSDIDFVLHGAGILNSYSIVSPEKYVLDCERIRYARRFERGFELNEETFALDLIDEVGPGGHFLNKRHTLDHCDTEHFMTNVYNRQSLDDWESEGKRDSFELAHERVQELEDEYERPSMPEELDEELQRYVEEGKAEILDE